MICEQDTKFYGKHITFSVATHTLAFVLERQPQHWITLVFLNSAWVLLRPSELSTFKELWEGTSGLLSLSKKTRKSNHLQMKLQRQHFLLSYLKTLSVGLVGVTNSWPPASQRVHIIHNGYTAGTQPSEPAVRGGSIRVRCTVKTLS